MTAPATGAPSRRAGVAAEFRLAGEDLLITVRAWFFPLALATGCGGSVETSGAERGVSPGIGPTTDHVVLCGIGKTGCAQAPFDVTALTNLCGDSLPLLQFNGTGDQNKVRVGGVALAVGAEAGHLLVATHAKEGTIGTLACTTDLSVSGHLDIGFVESFNGGKDWSEAVVISDLPSEIGSDQFMPSIAVQDDGAVLITYYDRSVDPSGSQVQQKIAVRRRGEASWTKGVRRKAAGELTDLSLLPAKCDGTPHFIGDYHDALGGRTHVHALRVDAPVGSAPGTALLQAAALSGTAWE